MNQTDLTDTASQLRYIKRSLHGMMNGPVSASMRERGLTYKVNFGVEIPRLREFSNELPHTYELASALWKEDIRECRILAGLLMPAESFDWDLAEVWIEQMRFAEEAECTVMNLFSRLPDASTKAFEWMASDSSMYQLCGYLLLARLLTQGGSLTERDALEFLDHAVSALKGNDLSLKRAAYNCIMKFQSKGQQEEQMADKVLDLL